MTEEDRLVELARSGDQAAFRGLVDIYATLIERLARVLLSNRADAEDAVQEAWLDAWRGLPGFEVGRPFRPWLLAITSNRCRMVARRLKPAGAPYDDAALDNLLSQQGFGAASPTGGAYYDELQTLVDGLDEGHRQLLALRFFADLQLDEIAEILDVPVGTVKSRLHRLLHLLRHRLTDGGTVENSKR